MAQKKASGQTTPTIIAPRHDTPFIFFDSAPACALQDSIIHVELAVRVVVPTGDGSVAAAMIEAGRLRCGLTAAKNLIASLQKAVSALEKGVPLAPFNQIN